MEKRRVSLPRVLGVRKNSMDGSMLLYPFLLIIVRYLADVKKCVAAGNETVPRLKDHRMKI